MLLVGGGEREPDVFVHKADVEPGLVGAVEDKRQAGLEHRRADCAFGHHRGGAMRVDPVAFGEEQAF